MTMGINGQTAPELRVEKWIGADGKDLNKPLQLADLGDGHKMLYCFQAWCPGCHSRGFPALQKIHAELAGKGLEMAVIQTVFEGFDQNSEDMIGPMQARYDLPIPFGHDVPAAGAPYPTIMEDYRTAGTPWFILIDPNGKVVYNDFRLDADRFIAAFQNREHLEFQE